MTFDAVGVFGLTFDFLLKICLSILCYLPCLVNIVCEQPHGPFHKIFTKHSHCCSLEEQSENIS